MNAVFKSAADMHAMLWRYRDKTDVKEPVEVGTQEKSIECVVQSVYGNRFDVRSLKNWQSAFPGNRTSSTICVRDQSTKRPLSSPRAPQAGSAVCYVLVGDLSGAQRARLHEQLHGIPDSTTVFFCRVDAFSGDNVAGKTLAQEIAA